MRLDELTRRLEGALEGDGAREIQGVGSLEAAGPEDLSFVEGGRYKDLIRQTEAGALLVGSDFQGQTTATLIRVANVRAALETVLEIFAPEPDVPESGVHPTAQVAPGARIGAGAAIGEHVVIREGVQIGSGSVISAGCIVGRGVEIGENCFLAPQVVVYQGCRIGRRVRIHANSTIGADGFGYRFVEGRHKKIPHIGIVIIEDDVEIGANSCVDRAKFGATVVGRGTKIDNLVQIGHNVQISEHCIIVAQVGLSGSAKLGRGVIVAGQAGIGDHCRIGDGAAVGAQAGVARSIPPGQKVAGTPARDLNAYYRDLASLKKIARLQQKIQELKADLEAKKPQ